MVFRSTYTEAKGDIICAGLAEGRSLLSICESAEISYEAAKNWERDVPEHATKSARAREIGCHALADQCLSIADTPQIGRVVTTKPDGAEETRHEDMIAHRRLRIETRMRLLGKWLPRVYGDKVDMHHSGTINLSGELAGLNDEG